LETSHSHRACLVVVTGLEIHEDKGLIAMIGRNSVLWHKQQNGTPFQTMKYGNVKGTVEPIEPIIPKLMVLARKLRIQETAHTSDTIVFYGEWYRFNETNAEASWHPFGYAVKLILEGELVNQFRTMTVERHAMFLEHGLDPPALLFHGGPLTKAVDALFPLMIEPPRPDFEGVFITSEKGGTRDCGKWKTGAFEEQTSFQYPATTCSEEMATAITQLKEVFETKQSVSKISTKKKMHTTKQEAEEQEMDRQIKLALRSVLSKSSTTIEDIRAMDRNCIAVEMKRLHSETLEDVCETYKASGMDPPPPKELKKRLGKLVAMAVFKGD